MKKILTIILSACMLLSQMACSSANIPNAINVITKAAPIALTEASALAGLAGNPALAAILQTAATDVNTDIPVVLTAVDAYNNAKTSGNLAAITAATSSLASNVNAQLLAANKIAVTPDEKLAVASLGALALTLNGMVIALQNAGVKVSMNIPAHEILPYVSHDELVKAANEYNVTYNQAVSSISGL